MRKPLGNDDVVGLIRPKSDVHTLGLSHVRELLSECGIRAEIAGDEIVTAVERLGVPLYDELLTAWIFEKRISRLGFSYRLDPVQGKSFFDRFFHLVCDRGILSIKGGPVHSLYFAGLPETSAAIGAKYRDIVEVFYGDETPVDTLSKMGVPFNRIPRALKESSEYDVARQQFGNSLLASEAYLSTLPPARGGYSSYGTKQESLLDRLADARRRERGPLLRSHVGPYDPDRHHALNTFKDWLHRLSRSGYLDIVSIGTSQLTQERFGKDWSGYENGGGVPVNSINEYEEIWQAARPMLVRTYAGTADVPSLARIHDAALNNAWHALSLWWFCRIDGRGQNSVYKNLHEHIKTLAYIGDIGKPFEPNIPHHFAFRGADDVTYVLSAYLASKTAKRCGVRSLVLQIMLNTPRSTWGIQDLAKARATLHFVRSLTGRDFQVFLQPRAGLDCFPPDLDRAKVQLSAVTALMDDIEPDNPASPPMIHVVSYSEAVRLADPDVIDESLQITLASLKQYRDWKRINQFPDNTIRREIDFRTTKLIEETSAIIKVIEREIEDPYSIDGLYRVFAAGFMPVPYLWEDREEFRYAVNWHTKVVKGGVSVIDQSGQPMSAAVRAELAAHNLQFVSVPPLNN